MLMSDSRIAMIKYHFSILILLCTFIGSYGFSQADIIYPPNWPWRGITITTNTVTDEDIRYLAELHVNSLTIFMNTRTLIKSGKHTSQQAFQKSIQRTDTILDAAKKYGMTCVITMSHFPLSATSPDVQNTRDFWINRTNYQEMVETADNMARYFKNRGSELGAYELMSEPLLFENKTPKRPDSWILLMNDIIRSIRKHDPKRHIIVTPGPGGLPLGYKDFLPLKDPYIMYGAHMYIPHTYTHQGIQGRPSGVDYPGRILLKYWDKKALEQSMGPLIDFQNNHKVLVWIGEFSAVRWAPGAEAYLRDVIDIFDSHNWGWSYFCYGDYHGWNPDYNTQYSSDAPADWNKQYIGKNTSRWKLLKDIYSKNEKRVGL